jgi:hypothetical protein
MIDDPIVAEIHQIREEYARKFNYDLDEILKDLQRLQEESGIPVVSFPSKPARFPAVRKATESANPPVLVPRTD